MDEIFKSNAKPISKELRLDADEQDSPFGNEHANDVQASSSSNTVAATSPASINVKSTTDDKPAALSSASTADDSAKFTSFTSKKAVLYIAL